MVRCVQCDAELVAPVRSEYWNDKHACHIWLCPKCCACFSSVVAFPAETKAEPLKEYFDRRSFAASVAAGRISRQDGSRLSH